MADNFGADLTVMQQAARHVRDVNVNIGGQLTTLRTQLEGLDGAWLGQSATGFAALKVRWDEDTRKVNDALIAIADALDKSHTTYSATDTAASSEIARIASMLDG